jgi:hypothetical protein
MTNNLRHIAKIEWFCSVQVCTNQAQSYWGTGQPLTITTSVQVGSIVGPYYQMSHIVPIEVDVYITGYDSMLGPV